MKWLGIMILALVILPSFLLAGNFHMVLENDLLAKTDRHYTHGTRFFYLKDSAPSWTDNFFKDRDKRWGIGLAQYLYTPSDITIAELIEDDRPYGGWLYIGNVLFARDNKNMDMVGIDVGITGKSSLSEETQKFVHKVIDSNPPKGWDNQIEEELGVNLLYQKKYRWRWKYIDIIPHAGGSLGNIFTYLNAGGMIRAGYSIPDNFGHLKLEPAARVKRFGAYLFADVDGRLVGRNIFLDGNTFEDSHSVDKKHLVGDFNFGTGIIFGNFELIYSNTFRSKEFKGQNESDQFGTLSLSWDY